MACPDKLNLGGDEIGRSRADYLPRGVVAGVAPIGLSAPGGASFGPRWRRRVPRTGVDAGTGTRRSAARPEHPGRAQRFSYDDEDELRVAWTPPITALLRIG
ncbi:unnamed protein product [Lampetra planeri]